MKMPASDTLPCTAGIGLRAPHYAEVLKGSPKPGWVEVHSENFFGGGSPLRTLLKVRENYPVSLHGVGMGLASTTPLDQAHLSALIRLCDAVQPAAVSEHLCWNSAPDYAGDKPLVINDLLPFPYTQQALPMWRAASTGPGKTGPPTAGGKSFQLSDLSQQRNERRRISVRIIAAHRLCHSVRHENLYVNARNLGTDACAYIQSPSPAGR